MTTTSTNCDRLPGVGEELKANDACVKLVREVGDGGYGSVFIGELQQTGQQFAVKVEKYSRSMLHIEVNVLKQANEAQAKHFCQMLAFANVNREFTFLIMTLLGSDLHRLRSERPDRRFSYSTAFKASIQCLEAIKELHGLGFLSRDIKPGNFAPGLRATKQNKTIFMYDFGLARKYVDRYNNIIPSRGEIGWRGTQRYGSLQAHYRRDLARRDDIESWLYMTIELLRGSLPWRHIGERTVVQKYKEDARTVNRNDLLRECPPQIDEMLKYVDNMRFEDEPNYDYFQYLLTTAATERKIPLDVRWDWEMEHSDTSTVATDRTPSEREIGSPQN